MLMPFDDVGMSIVFSHRTSLLVYRVPGRATYMHRLPIEPAPLAARYPAKAALDRARIVLLDMGVPAEELETVDVLVGSDSVRVSNPAVRCRVFSQTLPPGALCRLADGVFATSPEFCFLQMANVFSDRRELIEFGYELCGGYELSIDPAGAYRDRPTLATVNSIRALLSGFTKVKGLRTAFRALTYVRDGARSPMEAATAMTLVLPKRLGGLGVRSLRMDMPVPVPREFRGLTRYRKHVCDCLVLGKKLDLEYNGFHHDDEVRKVEDEERRSALEAMGYRVKVLSKRAFFDCVAYRRYLRSLLQIFGIDETYLPEGFWAKQEELRRFVLRRWL